jgi:hypothetical protein
MTISIPVPVHRGAQTAGGKVTPGRFTHNQYQEDYYNGSITESRIAL